MSIPLIHFPDICLTDQSASLVVFDGQDVTNGVWNLKSGLTGESQMV
jgi:hypothetical protein